MRIGYISEEVQRIGEIGRRSGYQQSRRIRGEGMVNVYVVE